MSVFHNGVTYRAADAHAHIYPGKIAEKATGSVGEFYHIPMQNVGLPHILAQRGEEAGIDRFLVCSVATKVEQVRSINQFIQEKCQKYPQFIGLAAWHQDVADIQGEMDDIQRRGLRGIKLHPDFQRFYIDDERMLPVYEEAHRRGCKMDGWSDYFSLEKWMEVFASCGVDPAFYNQRRREFTEVLPWDHLDYGIRKDFLIEECRTAYKNRTSPDCKEACSACGAACFQGGICFETR